jgi:predicted HTH transcriptional regulator
MRILRDPLESITAADIQQLCADEVSESTELELKSDLPSKAGKQADPWYAGNAFGDYARNKIAEEVVAFANTLGGVVCIGIEESSDHPKRAVATLPLPRVHELARRLRQSVYDMIDPPLPILEAAGVEFGTNGDGVVLLRVPPSRRRPHRNQANKEVFVRRAEESVRVSMREVQELTLQAVSEAAKTDTIIADSRKKYREQFYSSLRSSSVWGCPTHISRFQVYNAALNAIGA